MLCPRPHFWEMNFFFTIDRRIKEQQDRKASRQFSGQRFFLYVDQ